MGDAFHLQNHPQCQKTMCGKNHSIELDQLDLLGFIIFRALSLLSSADLYTLVNTSLNWFEIFSHRDQYLFCSRRWIFEAALCWKLPIQIPNWQMDFENKYLQTEMEESENSLNLHIHQLWAAQNSFEKLMSHLRTDNFKSNSENSVGLQIHQLCFA